MKDLLSWRHFVIHFAAQDLKRQHSATVLGYWWVVITSFITIFGISWVYSALWNTSSRAFLPYLSAGVLIWNFVANTFNESTRLFPGQAPILTNFTIPPITFIYLLVLRQLFILLYATVIHVFVLWFCGSTGGPQWHTGVFLLVPLGYLLMAVTVICLCVPASLAATRYRDLAPLINNLTYLAFLITPILWREEQLPQRARFYMNFNPFVWVFRTIRPLMLGQLPEPRHAIAMIGAVIVAAPLCLLLYRRTVTKLPYWVH